MTNTPQIRRLGEALGAEATGIDLSRPLDDDSFAWIEEAFAEHPVLVFRDPHLGAAELAAFGGQRSAVLTDPVSGRRMLFVNPLHTHGFLGTESDAAVPLIEELTRHATEDRCVYYHAWRVGDVLMWDEMATMHRGAGDYHPEERRLMVRTIVHHN